MEAEEVATDDADDGVLTGAPLQRETTQSGTEENQAAATAFNYDGACEKPTCCRWTETEEANRTVWAWKGAGSRCGECRSR